MKSNQTITKEQLHPNTLKPLTNLTTTPLLTTFEIKTPTSHPNNKTKLPNLNSFQGFIHSLHDNNIRSVTLLFVRFCIEVGILTLPFYMKVYGGVTGTLMFLLAAYVNYLMYTFLQSVGEATETHDFMGLTRLLTPWYIQKIFKVTYLFDLTSVIFSTMIILYNIFQYLVAFVDLIPEDWYQNKELLVLKTYHPPVVMYRFLFNFISFLLFLPFMFRPNLGGLKTISNNYLVVLVILCIFILIEMGFFRANLSKQADFTVNYFYSTPSGEWVGSFFGIMLAFYAQQYFFCVRKELVHPTAERVRTTTKFSMIILSILFVILGKFFFVI
jgi:hypothetical protein